jgi:site-specific recombinase XerC
MERIEAVLIQLLAAIREGKPVVSKISSQGAAGALTVAELCNQFLESKYKAGRSDNYVGLLIKELRSFAKERIARPVASISAAEIETWLHGQGWSAPTKRGRLITLKNLFAWAIKRDLLAVNPALGVDLPRVIGSAPGIHTPETVAHVLETARRVDLNVMRCMAVRYFAGLRTSEAVALEEKEIGEKFIEVTAAKAKTRRRRLVTVHPALTAWLAMGGVLPLKQVNNRLRAVTQAAAVEWPKNATRHSFVTYHLAEFQNAGKTALEAGHTEQILFGHYREIVTPDIAKQFWAIRPRQG